MKINKWIMWVILFSSLFGIANKGISIIAFILSIVALTKFVLVDKNPLILMQKTTIQRFNNQNKLVIKNLNKMNV